MWKWLKEGWRVRTLFGWFVTIAALVATSWYLHAKAQAANKATLTFLLEMSPENFGQWLSGIAGTLAFLWLVIGYFQQGEELRNQIRETNRLANASEDQLRSIAANEKHTRRDLFSRIAQQTLEELDSIAARILISCKQEPIIEHRKAAEKARTAGYKDAYLTELIAVFERRRSDWQSGPQGDLDQLAWWLIRFSEAECENEVPRYLSLMEMLLAEAQLADSGGSFEQLIKNSRAHDLYKTLTRFRTYRSELEEIVPSIISWTKAWRSPVT